MRTTLVICIGLAQAKSEEYQGQKDLLRDRVTSLEGNLRDQRTELARVKAESADVIRKGKEAAHEEAHRAGAAQCVLTLDGDCVCLQTLAFP